MPPDTNMGNVTKLRPDGSAKHRLIQDLRANQVNRAARVPERQVLPRPRDHVVDLSKAATVKRNKANTKMTGGSTKSS